LIPLKKKHPTKRSIVLFLNKIFLNAANLSNYYQVNSSSVNCIQQTLPPPVQISNVDFQLISFSVNILKEKQINDTPATNFTALRNFTNPQNGTTRSACPVPARNLSVQFWEVCLHNGFLKVLQAGSSRQFVAHPLKVVPAKHLLMHVVEELAPAILLHDFSGPIEGVNQVPMPVVKINAQILTEVR
jgi:hypothetical protein